MVSDLTFAIIGCGNIGKRHAIHINNLARLAAVCDIDEDKANSLSLQYGAKVYTSLDKLLENEKFIDVIAICTPNGLHAIHTIQCLKSGHHVVCEKPMAITSADCKQM